MPRDSALQGKLVFVMGGGKFGTNALRYLKSKGSKVLVVDIDPNCKATPEADIQADSLDAWNSLKNGQPAFLVGDAHKLVTLERLQIIPLGDQRRRSRDHCQSE